jgi:hypothetical protein
VPYWFFGLSAGDRAGSKGDKSSGPVADEFRPIQFCLFLKSMVGAEHMERMMVEAIAVAKQQST